MITVSGTHPQNIHAPQRPGDVGYDLALRDHILVPAGGLVWAHTGVQAGFPKGVWGEIVGRSSTVNKYGLIVMCSIIDTGYTGELDVGLYNIRSTSIRLEPGTRVAQMILRETVKQGLQLGALPDTDRGAQGFGSTGL